jgi:hypothetical protein
LDVVVFFTLGMFIFGLPYCLAIWDVPTWLGVLNALNTKNPSSSKFAPSTG